MEYLKNLSIKNLFKKEEAIDPSGLISDYTNKENLKLTKAEASVITRMKEEETFKKKYRGYLMVLLSEAINEENPEKLKEVKSVMAFVGSMDYSHLV